LVENLSNKKRCTWHLFYFYSDFVSVSFFLGFDVAPLSSFVASLNSFIPEPNPFISSGIFLPPNSNSITTTIKIISVAPNLENIIYQIYLSVLFFVSSSLVASLTSFIPDPHARINSGIFLPPNNNKITATITIICHGDGIAKNTANVFIL